MIVFIYIPILLFLLYKGLKLGLLETICLVVWWTSVYFFSAFWGFIVTVLIVPIYYACANIREEEFRRNASPEMCAKLARFDWLHKDDWHQRYTQKWGNEFNDHNL